MTAPLAGIIVVAVEQAVAAPFATRQLADLGARVLKIERPDGGDLARHYDTACAGQSAYFVWANRGKDSLALDLKDADDRATFEQLLDGADVFIQNLAPAAAERAGLLARQVRATRPRLVACDISGYGMGGPRTDDKAYDLAIQAESGVMAVTGTGDAISKVGFSAADIGAAMYAFSSILAALYRRATTGEGAAVEVSMLECLAEWVAPHLYAAAGRGSVPPPVGHRHALIAPYGVYPLADGRRVLIAVQAHHEWVTLATDVLGMPQLVDDPRFATNPDRIANVEALEAELGAALGALPADEALHRLATHRVAHARVNGLLDVWEHEQLRARERFTLVSTETGEAEILASPFGIDATPPPPPVVPALGAHDPALVEELLRRATDR